MPWKHTLMRVRSARAHGATLASPNVRLRGVIALASRVMECFAVAHSCATSSSTPSAASVLVPVTPAMARPARLRHPYPARAAVREGCYFGGHRVVIAAGAYAQRRGAVRRHTTRSASVAEGARRHGSHDPHRVVTTSVPPECRAGAIVPAPVTIEDGAWIGARAILMPGVTIGAGAVIAAGCGRDAVGEAAGREAAGAPAKKPEVPRPTVPPPSRGVPKTGQSASQQP